MNAHRLVIIAAALTTVVAAALATALATFGGQALPRAVRDDLTSSSGTTMVIGGEVSAAQAAQYSATLPRQIAAALGHVPFGFYQAVWSDPLGFVPGSLPASPASAGNTPIAEAAALGDVTAHATLVSGRWPGAAAPAPGSGQPIQAALPATAAALMHVSTGDVLRLKDRVSGHVIRFVVTGLYRPAQVSGASAEYWSLDDIALSGSSTASGFTTYGPLTVQASAFAGPTGPTGPTGPLTADAGSWLAQPQTASIPAGQLTTVAANVTTLQQSLQDAIALPALTLTTSLPAVLHGTASDLDVARSLLAICAVLLFLLAAAALLAVARLLAGQREGESAMMAARGATRWQLLRMTTAEAVPLCLVSAAVGGVLGVLLAKGLASTTWSAGDALPAAAAVAVGALIILLVPALSTVSPGTARVRRGRQAAISTVSRAGVDLALIALAVLAGWQLRDYSAVSAGSNGNFGVDPVIVIAPALALAGGTVVALRLLPVGGKVGDRLAARGRRLTAAMASWQISRQPLRQGGAALLIVLAVATGTLALSQRQSWIRSDHDQAAFSSGADVRVQTSQPLTAAQAGALAQTPGVQHAMPVAIFTQPTNGSQTLALDAGQAADVALLRADQSS
ncbi:MAG: FtsX-like permease family protein, partial [Streptosporangiaceae bacterium]